MATRRLFDLEINGERKNLFVSMNSAQKLQVAVIAEGDKAVIFEHSESEIEVRMREAAGDQLMRLGIQYYVAARSAAWAGLLPVTGNLYHHSVEMLLKSGLSKKYSLSELKQKFDHKLPDIWKAFKEEFPTQDLTSFDSTIGDVADFEEIRYPDSLIEYGAEMIVDFRGAATPMKNIAAPARAERLYRFYFDDVDRLIGAIFIACGKSLFAFTLGLKLEVREMLARDNPIAAHLLMQRG